MVKIGETYWFYQPETDKVQSGRVMSISNDASVMVHVQGVIHGPIESDGLFETKDQALEYKTKYLDEKIARDYTGQSICDLVNALLDDTEHMSKYEPIIRRLIAKQKELPVFYFTYASNPQFPYQDGWTEVSAPDRSTACQIFNTVHPPRDGENCVNCSWIYDQEQFRETSMYKSGKNFDKGCVERLSLNVMN